MGDQGFLRQFRHRVLRRETGNVMRCFYGTFNSRLRKIRSTGIATAVTHVHRDTQRFVAVTLYVFKFAFAHRHAQATTFGSLGSCVAGTQAFGMC